MDGSGEAWRAFVEDEAGDLNAVAIEGQRVLVAGSSRTILLSDDFGENWTLYDSDDWFEINAIAFDKEKAILAGDSAGLLVAGNLDHEEFGKVEFRTRPGPSSEPFATAELMDQLYRNEGKLDQLEQQRFAATTAGSATSSGNANAFWLHTTGLRLAILIAVIFTCRHLFGIARYNWQLASFYFARADAAQLMTSETMPWPDRVDQFAQAVAALSPDNLQTGTRMPEILESSMRRMRHVLRPPRE